MEPLDHRNDLGRQGVRVIADGLLYRPPTVADIDVLWSVFGGEEGAGPHQWFGFTSFAAVRRAAEERDLLGGDDNMLVVERDGELVARLEWMARYWGRRDTSKCWEISAAVVPPYRGHGLGTKTQSWLVRYLFEHTAVHRLQATTDAQNLPEQRCLGRAGFTLEGRVAGAQWRAGQFRDQLLYGQTRGGVEAGAVDAL